MIWLDMESNFSMDSLLSKALTFLSTISGDSVLTTGVQLVLFATHQLADCSRGAIGLKPGIVGIL